MNQQPTTNQQQPPQFQQEYIPPPPEHESDDDFEDPLGDMETNAHGTAAAVLTPEQQEEKQLQEFMDLLVSGNIKQHMVNPKNLPAQSEEPPKIFTGVAMLYIPATRKMACGICFSVLDALGDETAVREQARIHHEKCAKLDPHTDCLVCRVRLMPESAADHFLSKGHTEKRKLIRAKIRAGDDFAFYYTQKGVGQSRPIDGSPFKAFSWIQKEQTILAYDRTAREKSAIYEYKITKSVASCKDVRVANLTFASDVLILVDILCQHATIGVLPCDACSNGAEYEVPAILRAVELSMPERSRSNFFQTHDSKCVCQNCGKVLQGFNKPKLIITACMQIKNMITTATVPRERAPQT